MACLSRLRSGELVAQGYFRDLDAAAEWARALETLHADPSRHEIAERLELAAELLDEAERTREVRNWIEHCAARGRSAARAGAHRS